MGLCSILYRESELLRVKGGHNKHDWPECGGFVGLDKDEPPARMPKFCQAKLSEFKETEDYKKFASTIKRINKKPVKNAPGPKSLAGRCLMLTGQELEYKSRGLANAGESVTETEAWQILTMAHRSCGAGVWCRFHCCNEPPF